MRRILYDKCLFNGYQDINVYQRTRRKMKEHSIFNVIKSKRIKIYMDN